MLRAKYEAYEQGLKTVDLAQMVGIKPQAMSRILNGKEPAWPRRGQRVADALGWDRPWQELFEEIEVD